MTGPLQLEIPAVLDELAGARRTVRRWLTAEGLEPTVVADLLAVASEFLLSAIVRAAGTGSVRLVGERRPDGVRLAVRAASAAAGAPRAIHLPGDPLAHGALGRRLVEGCCDSIEITADDDGGGAECWRRTVSASADR